MEELAKRSKEQREEDGETKLQNLVKGQAEDTKKRRETDKEKDLPYLMKEVSEIAIKRQQAKVNLQNLQKQVIEDIKQRRAAEKNKRESLRREVADISMKRIEGKANIQKLGKNLREEAKIRRESSEETNIQYLAKEITNNGKIRRGTEDQLRNLGKEPVEGAEAQKEEEEEINFPYLMKELAENACTNRREIDDESNIQYLANEFPDTEEKINVHNLGKYLFNGTKKRISYTVDISVMKHWTNEEHLPLEKLQELKEQWIYDDWDGLFDPPFWLIPEMFSIALTDINSNCLKRHKLSIAAENLNMARLATSSTKIIEMNPTKDKLIEEVTMKLYEEYKYAVNFPLKVFLSNFENTNQVFLMKMEANNNGIELEKTTMEIAKDIRYGLTSYEEWENAKLKHSEASLDAL